MDKIRRLAVIEFRHGRGCSTGQPYGECTPDCTWKVVKVISESLTREEQVAYGVKPEEVRY
jgi:hypothetical protein